MPSNSKIPQAAEPEPQDEDVEGHSMLPMDTSTARAMSSAREADIRRHLAKHDLEEEARRTHKK